MSAETSFFHGAARVAGRNLTVWRRYAAASALGNFGEPLLYLIALGYGLGRVVPPIDGLSYPEFLAPALIVSTVMYTATFEGTFGAYTRLTTQGTFDAILATPVTVSEIVAGEILWGGLKSAFGATVVLTVVRAFGLVPSWLALGVVPLGFLAGAMFYAMALCMTALSKSYEFFNYYFTLVVAPMYLFSGVFFPLEGAPPWAHRLAQVLPLTHVVAVSRGLVRGQPTWSTLGHAAVVLGCAAAAMAVAARLLRRRLQI
ncbi:MAG: ABC transporter permease [Myxococcales bacterium]|nr:ABC transporter permease [Myxococcales bacterium]